MSSGESKSGGGEGRTVVKKFKAVTRKEGAGFTIHRPIGDTQMSTAMTDPFLMLDELGPITYGKGEFEGAPWHPHRGIDTVMYLKEGQGDHQDSTGNKGTLYAGDCQWMTAGSGIIHDEGRNHPGGKLHGFQMWINLPKKHKWTDPAYRTIRSNEKPHYTNKDGSVQANIIAGTVGDVKAKIQPVVPIQYIEFMLEPNAAYTHNIPKEMETCIVYVYEGDGTFSSKEVKAERRSTLLFSKDGGAVSFAAGEKGLKFLLLAGKKLKEPVAWHGPFVMNTQEEIMDCIRDYQNGKLVRAKPKELLAKSWK
eukprot:CAMPEP_0185260204 /NCGR_PEP_ID=MMETSP1359-20130426/8829_1 /TAXON_ID=552665 /ORGANISM="Bigelowiella longifila, Strain CCMP242" /LENGTH=307 /DNA_ID=CAMNT_0027846371 /DNA_START=98 /DNA_END=1024 /DNA_ORIENTATION=+